MIRILALWCLDWPVVALGHGPGEAVAVVWANRVVACSPAARHEGVRRGLRRREAQGRCPQLVVRERDVAAEARHFEPVLIALDDITPRVELTRPGRAAFPTIGPARYFGGDQALAERVAQRVGEVLEGRGRCRVGVADGAFAAEIAARHAPDGGGHVVPSGEAAVFLAPLPVTLLDRPELCDVLHRLGLRTMGKLAGVPRADMVGRFGAEGERAHRLASGLDERILATSTPPPELEMVAELDPPLERIDQAAFVAKRLADDLLDRLHRIGATCPRVLIEAETEHGEHTSRCWRHEGALTAAAIADRVRWQLEGWQGRDRRTSGALTKLCVRPDVITPAGGRQLGFWGEQTEAAERAQRAVARLQGLLGPGAVQVPERRGGRSPADQIVLVPAEGVELSRSSIDGGVRPGPWPGALPAPAPARVPTGRPAAEVVDAAGGAVLVSGRGLISAPPARVRVGAGEWQPVVQWSGPWPLDERWWDPVQHRRQARIQVVTHTGWAHLLVLEGGVWHLAATYD